MGIGQTVKISTRTDVKADGTGSVGQCDVVASRDFNGVTATLTVKPKLPGFSTSGLSGTDISASADLVLSSNNVTATFDGIDAGMSSIEAPRIGYKHNLEAGGNTYGLAATFVRKGNSDAKNSDDTIKLACTMPKFEGIGSKLEYDTLSKKASVTADKAFNDTKAKIKVDAKDGSVSWKATVSHPLPEGVGLTADINNKQAGTIALAKDAFTLEMPYSVSGGVTASSAKLKYKWSTTLDL